MRTAHGFRPPVHAPRATHGRAPKGGALHAMRPVLMALVAAASLGMPAPAASQGRPDDVGTAMGTAIQQAIAGIPLPADGAVAHGLSRATLRQLYGDSAVRPHWTDDGGRPTAQAVQALAVLGGSDARGLRPADYGVDTLRRWLDALMGASAPADADVARFDTELSLQMMRLAAHLHAGRVNPRTVGFDLPETHDSLDLAGLALEMSGAADVAAVVRGVEPPYAGYEGLAGALARYRTLAAGPDPRPPAPRMVIRPGDPYQDAAALARYLAMLGDLPRERVNDVSAAGAVASYDSALVAGVMVFQERHGLQPDGVIGPATVVQLRVPLARRVQQIELAMERWRWLPDVAPQRYVVVNVPAFRLYTFENDATASRPLLRMNVVVGQAQGRSATPLFVGSMREVVFQPYWDVPISIARGELLPRARSDAGYLDRENLEIVRGGDHDAVVYPPTASNFDRVAAGTLRLRQRPGADNSLGPVKLLFPNQYNVYLHGTPATELFARTRRDFSHGCIRVEDPTALAEWVLQGQDAWNRESVVDAMTTSAQKSRRVRVARPVSVYILYTTAVVGDDGLVRFYEDIYGHDGRLARSLE